MTELDLSGMGLNDEEIASLRYMTNLRILILVETQFDRNQISNISPLAGLTNLERLFLRDNQISDITPLAGLTNLHTLSLDFINQIYDWSPVEHVENIGGRP